MRNYVIRIMVDGILFSECFSNGTTALDALESALELGILIKPNVEGGVDAIAISQSGYAVKFKIEV